jgi:hypothetical protein
MVPEPLVTIRSYSSPEPAEEDCRLLINAGIDAYLRTHRRRETGEVRVPESQVEAAMALLPPAAPDLFAPQEVPRVCPWCGCDRARFPSPIARLLSVVGVIVAASLAIQREFALAGLAASFTALVAYVGKISGDELVCTNCGREWRAPRAAPGLL